jgi:hypothetical protein
MAAGLPQFFMSKEYRFISSCNNIFFRSLLLFSLSACFYLFLTETAVEMSAPATALPRSAHPWFHAKQ